MSEPNWIIEGRKLIGLHEAAGDADNPKVVKLFEDAGHPEVVHDSTAWCAAFVGAVLKRSGLKGNGSLWALDYAKWGQPLDGVALGAVATKRRFNAAGKLVGGHVFFVVGWEGDKVYGLGGNQADRVSVNAYPRSVVAAYRWPNEIPPPGPQPSSLPVTGATEAGSEA
jgi:uncharacterized protein (TIGR02594 family)